MQCLIKQKMNKLYSQTAQKNSHFLSMSTETYFLFLDVINPAIANKIINPATPPKI